MDGVLSARGPELEHSQKHIWGGGAGKRQCQFVAGPATTAPASYVSLIQPDTPYSDKGPQDHASGKPMNNQS